PHCEDAVEMLDDDETMASEALVEDEEETTPKSRKPAPKKTQLAPQRPPTKLASSGRKPTQLAPKDEDEEVADEAVEEVAEEAAEAAAVSDAEIDDFLMTEDLTGEHAPGSTSGKKKGGDEGVTDLDENLWGDEAAEEGAAVADEAVADEMIGEDAVVG